MAADYDGSHYQCYEVQLDGNPGFFFGIRWKVQGPVVTFHTTRYNHRAHLTKLPSYESGNVQGGLAVGRVVKDFHGGVISFVSEFHMLPTRTINFSANLAVKATSKHPDGSSLLRCPDRRGTPQ